MTKKDEKANSKKNKNIAEKIKEVADKVKEKVKKQTPLERIEELEKQNTELKNDFLRSRADFENFRKRKEKESLELRDRVVTDFVLEILPAIDNFEMALKMTDNTNMLIKGVEMIHSNLMETLKAHKFEEFSVKEGENFDINLHDPILIESKDHKPGKIISMVQKGYKKQDKVVRPARVQILKEE